MFVLVIVWALGVMALAHVPNLHATPLIEILFYAVAGVGWVLPAMPLVRWMARPDPPR